MTSSRSLFVFVIWASCFAGVCAVFGGWPIVALGALALSAACAYPLLGPSEAGAEAEAPPPPSAAAPPSAEPVLGSIVPGTTNFGAYQLLELLGSGTMGELWRAKHRALGRTVALKRIKAETVNAEDIARFKREARATSELRSPHTVEVYDFGEEAGVLFYAMECLDGIDLQHLIERDGAMPVARAVDVLLQACHSLADAHALEVVHRDIKPSNLMLCRYGLNLDFVKLLDFGLAKATQKDTVDVGLTRRGVVLGTAAYIAPESLKGSSFVDARADLYALGAVAFWLVTGRLLFLYDQPMEMVRAHLGEAPPTASSCSPFAIPAELDALILACLQKDPAARPASATELAVLLRAVPLESA